MKVFLVILLAAILCIESGFALKCLTCSAKTNNADCQASTNCPMNSTDCKTELYVPVVGGWKVIKKECSSSCKNSTEDFYVFKQKIFCCSTDNCNTNGVGRMESSSMVMAVGIATSVACFLLTSRL
ncbi:prostate stem cell antigen [Alligator mississippiensis]|uniref:Prostate stem cell antigen n=1 Tax=Alligator mississippiensis TaxID=8496 RepID=A0A151P955_ALLMI|nr:prostate stem cell antigen [Alligator mississippiensis]KYO45275.1 prostate stem cell antigen [Alligator mississippiensis]